MKKVIDAIYEYLYDTTDPDDCKVRLDRVLEFVIRLRHSFVDNDKPMSAVGVNKEILRIAELEGLRIGFVKIAGNSSDI